MVLEPIIGFLICGALLVLLPIYLRYFHSEAERVPEFEAWVASQPLVMALACPEARSVELLYALRSSLKQGEFRNPAGGYPWQHYVVTLEARRLEGGAVGLFVVAARPLKEVDRGPVFGPWLDDVLRGLPGTGDAWLHGRMRGSGAIADRERVGWSVRLAETGAAYEPMIGRPAWLGEARRAA